MMRRFSSLRFRLLIGTTVAITVLLSILGFTIDFVVRRALLSEFDASLVAQARAIASMSEQRVEELKFEVDPMQMPTFSAKSKPDYFIVRMDDGRLLAKSDSLHSQHFGPEKIPDNMQIDYGTLPDGRYGRLLAMNFVPRYDPEDTGPKDPPMPMHSALLVVGKGTSELHHTMELLRQLIASLSIAAIVLFDVTLIAVTSQAIKPVGELAEEINSFSITDLNHRLPRAEVPAELLPVVDRLNELLARLGDAFAREKSFTADVAHELRTPLAGILTSIEVCRSRPRDSREYELVLDKCKRLSANMQSMCENLLTLARAEAGALPVSHDCVNLTELLCDSWLAYEPLATERKLHAVWDFADVELKTDSEKLRMIVNNLFSNAVIYSDHAGSISVITRSEPGKTTIEVANTGSKISPANIPNLTVRFWRGDTSRSSELHCGVGLSLCQRLTSLLHGQLNIESNLDQTFRVILTLPA